MSRGLHANAPARVVVAIMRSSAGVARARRVCASASSSPILLGERTFREAAAGSTVLPYLLHVLYR
jgi:hypothetical protein